MFFRKSYFGLTDSLAIYWHNKKHSIKPLARRVKTSANVEETAICSDDVKDDATMNYSELLPLYENL